MRSLARIGEEQETPIDDVAQLSLAAHIGHCFEAAKTAKQQITERLVKCDRQRRGIYDPEKLQEIQAIGGSEVYMMLTDVKCRAAEAWVKDIMLSAGEYPFDFDTTPIPNVPDDLRQGIIEHVVQEATAVQQMGMPLNPQVIGVRMKEVYDQVQKAINEEASTRAMRMTRKVQDQLQEGGWADSFAEVIRDFMTYPAAFSKGVVIRKRKELTWGADFKPVVQEVLKKEFERVSPYDAFPSPNASTVQEGYFIERHKLSRGDLVAMIDVPGYNSDEIRSVLDQYGRGGLRNWIYGDSDRNILENKRTAYFSPAETIEALEYWGSASGNMLIEWGMKGVDPYGEYEINAWLIGTHVIRAVINPDPLGRKPYSSASFEEVPGSIWGLAPPEMMRDIQIMCNASARALANNMAIASAPQVEVNVDRLPEGEDVTALYPWKIWQTTSDRTGGGQAAIKFYQPNMNAEALLNVFQFFSKTADEVTGIPNYVYGSSNVSGAGRTASGLSMLMENASKGMKQAIANLDGMVTDMLKRLYDHNMMYDPDQSIKGDMQIVAKGAIGLIMKEQLQIRRQEFLQATLNPVDTQIIGAAGRAELLREVGKGLHMDIDKVVPSGEQIIERQQEEQAAQMAMMQEQQAAEQAQQAAPQHFQIHRGEDGSIQGVTANPQNLNAAGEPAGGLNTVSPRG